MKKKIFVNAAVFATALTMVCGTILTGWADDKYVLGDLNGDKVVDIKDSALLKRHLAGWDVDFVNYGLNGNGSNNIGKSIPDDAVMFNGHYYYVFMAGSWSEANWMCQNLGGHLATLTSSEENTFVFDYMKSLNINRAFFGATDENSEGTWKWVTGEPFDYTNWANGEPNNDGKENYIEFYSGASDYKWNDGKDNSGYFICEWDILEGDDAIAETLTFETASGGDFIKDASEATVKFVLNGDSKNVTATIFNITNREVYTQSFENCQEGKEYTFNWDGKGTDGDYVSAGIYKVVVKAGTMETTSDTIQFLTENLFAGGDGSQSNPYLVSNLEQLKKVGSRNTKYFKQTADIDANYGSLDAMGSEDFPFKGHYDGSKYKISNLIINDGMFYKLEKDSVIENINFDHCSATGVVSDETGIVTQWNYGTVQNCTFSNCSSNTNGEEYSRAGVVCGINYDSGSVLNCTMEQCNVSVQGKRSQAGGICGLNRGVIINVSTNGTDVSSKTEYYNSFRRDEGFTWAGGITGYNVGIISYCSTTGDISAVNTASRNLGYAGGIAAANEGQISHSSSETELLLPNGGYSGQIVAANSGAVNND